MHLRQPAVAGRFYTDVPADLRAEVESFLKQGATLPASALAAGDAAHLAGLMLPHAGHVYSGRVIGATLAHVRLPRTVFLLCPNHTGLGTPLSVWPAGAWQTPLGPVPVDGEMARLLCEADEDFSADVMGHVREHSIEVLLPFLQVCAGDAPLHVVPVCVGTGQAPVLRTAGQRLARVLERCRSRDGQRPLLLVSSDMNHYEDQRTTLRKDDLALDAALKGDADALLATVAREGISMCGAAPLALAFLCPARLGARCGSARNPGHARNVRRCFARYGTRRGLRRTAYLQLLKGPSKKQAKSSESLVLSLFLRIVTLTQSSGLGTSILLMSFGITRLPFFFTTPT